VPASLCTSPLVALGRDAVALTHSPATRTLLSLLSALDKLATTVILNVDENDYCSRI